MLKPYNPEPPVRSVESSLRYDGWRVIFACFMVATFSWGLGFYGHGIYLAELQRAKGWPTSLMSTATTLYYLSGSLLVMYVSDTMQRLYDLTNLEHILCHGAPPFCNGIDRSVLGLASTLTRTCKGCRHGAYSLSCKVN